MPAADLPANAPAREQSTTPSLPVHTAKNPPSASFRTNAPKLYTAKSSSMLPQHPSTLSLDNRDARGLLDPPFARAKTARPVEQRAVERQEELQGRFASHHVLAGTVFAGMREQEQAKGTEKGIEKARRNLWTSGANAEGKNGAENVEAEGGEGDENSKKQVQNDIEQSINRKEDRGSALEQGRTEEGAGRGKGESEAEGAAPRKKDKHHSTSRSRSGTPLIVQAPQPQRAAGLQCLTATDSTGQDALTLSMPLMMEAQQHTAANGPPDSYANPFTCFAASNEEEGEPQTAHTARHRHSNASPEQQAARGKTHEQLKLVSAPKSRRQQVEQVSRQTSPITIKGRDSSSRTDRDEAEHLAHRVLGQNQKVRGASPATEGEEIEHLVRQHHHEGSQANKDASSLSSAHQPQDPQGWHYSGSPSPLQHGSDLQQEHQETIIRPTAAVIEPVSQDAQQQYHNSNPAFRAFPTKLLEKIAKYRKFHPISPPISIAGNNKQSEEMHDKVFVRLELKYCEPGYEMDAITEQHSDRSNQQLQISPLPDRVTNTRASRINNMIEPQHDMNHETYPSSAHCTQQPVSTLFHDMQDAQDVQDGHVLVPETLLSQQEGGSVQYHDRSPTGAHALADLSQMLTYYQHAQSFGPDTYQALDSQDNQSQAARSATDTAKWATVTDELGNQQTRLFARGHFELLLHLQCAGAELNLHTESWVKVLNEIASRPSSCDECDAQAVSEVTNKLSEIYHQLVDGGELHYSSKSNQLAPHQLYLVRNQHGKRTCRHMFDPLPPTLDTPPAMWEPEVRETARQMVFEQGRTGWEQKMQDQIRDVKRKATEDVADAPIPKVRKAAKKADIAYARFREALEEKRKEFAENEKDMKRILEERQETHRQRSVSGTNVVMVAA